MLRRAEDLLRLRERNAEAVVRRAEEALRRQERNVEAAGRRAEEVLRRQMQTMESRMSHHVTGISWDFSNRVVPDPPMPSAARAPGPGAPPAPVAPPPPAAAAEAQVGTVRSLWEHLEDDPEEAALPAVQAEETPPTARASFWARLFNL